MDNQIGNWTGRPNSMDEDDPYKKLDGNIKINNNILVSNLSKYK